MRLSPAFQSLLTELLHFPWRNTALTLRERFREDRLGLTASSLTFTTTIALVPLFTVALAIFSAFPMFGKLQVVLQRWLVDNLVPDTIARQVLGYLTQFARQASQLGSVGLVFLLATALALILTIDRTLNGIWRVRRKRRLAQRILVYWAAITLGPLVLGASITMTSFAVSVSRGLTGGALGWLTLLLDTVQFVILAGGAAAMYYYVPNTRVRWSHAWAGGIFASAVMELAKKLLVIYLGMVPTYSVVYGTFATVPILLVWIYLAWVIVLLGAVITAYMPSLLSGVVQRDQGPGWRFQRALEIMRLLLKARASSAHGLTAAQLAKGLRVSVLGVESTLQALVDLDWVARIEDDAGAAGTRHVLLAEPTETALEPLAYQLLLHRTHSTERWWRSTQVANARLSDVL
ncbi:MAG TPA: YihY family inner membrane protein [Burkholderiaceae bacterium]|nr:YihY family inner membrane protein [Rhodoferax sp.]HQX61123.1 YihY family inner membrane protein [Burkholderiaceae bacterium]HQZ07022.1 YihY family inner membrane protein [Burkholderiaceae bacterium]HRA63421.1 YihY family inner membrane protein [Burkholderiaceae bacterium]